MKRHDMLMHQYLELLSNDYPSRNAAFNEIINLQAILNLPKGTEHFMSDIHGEYEAFCHILNNCSGVIRDKVDYIFTSMSEHEKKELCTLVYYPVQKMQLLKEHNLFDDQWCNNALQNLIVLCSFMSGKYTRSKVRRLIGPDYTYIIDELLHAKSEETHSRQRYHGCIVNSIIENNCTEDFIIALCELAKRLAVDHLHIVGDIYDRGQDPDMILDLLMNYHSLDIQWGNHDMLWMGAASGSEVCVLTAVRNCIWYKCFKLLEKTYGVSLRPLIEFAKQTYEDNEHMTATRQAVAVLLFKLQGQTVLRNPSFNMSKRQLLEKVDLQTGELVLDGRRYELKMKHFPTVDPLDPYRLTEREQEIVDELVQDFLSSKTLQCHVDFLFSHGSMYRCYNDNLLFHGCVPMNEDGSFCEIDCNGVMKKGKEYLDYADETARRGRDTGDRYALDYMWYLWCGYKSPLSGRVIKTFERTLVIDESTYKEPRDPYYDLYYSEDICTKILLEFGLDAKGHIINGHTPIRVVKGESPVRANGRLIVIDGGFCKAYHKKTGIAGYTLIYSSNALLLKSHRPFTSVDDALNENDDISSEVTMLEGFERRAMVEHTDDGIRILRKINMLRELIKAYRGGTIAERT